MPESPQQPNNEENPAKKFLLLDTNTLSRASACRGDRTKASETVANQIVTYLKDLFSKENDTWSVAISSITYYELVNESSIEDEIKIEKALEGAQRFVVDDIILRIAARLGCFYGEKEVGVGKDQVSFADKIIAATAFVTGSIVYTTNMRDFPAPFFAEATQLRKIIQYESKGCPVYLPTYFMVPQGPVLNNYWEKRVSPIKNTKTG